LKKLQKEGVKVNLYLFKEDWEEFKKIATRELIPTNTYLRKILHEWIEKHKS
jgi:predicted DNA binding CopG/RHH family protein